MVPQRPHDKTTSAASERSRADAGAAMLLNGVARDHISSADYQTAGCMSRRSFRARQMSAPDLATHLPGRQPAPCRLADRPCCTADSVEQAASVTIFGVPVRAGARAADRGWLSLAVLDGWTLLKSKRHGELYSTL